MAKHNEIAVGDRHVPWDRSFANEAARLAYSYTANDVGHWFKDVDTGAVYELLTITPTFERAGKPENVLALIVSHENDVILYENEVVIYDG